MRTVQEMIMGRWKNKGVLSRKDSNVVRERQTETDRGRETETERDSLVYERNRKWPHSKGRQEMVKTELKGVSREQDTNSEVSRRGSEGSRAAPRSAQRTRGSAALSPRPHATHPVGPHLSLGLAWWPQGE